MGSCGFFAIISHSHILSSTDLIAYSGYKFVGVIVTIAAAALTKSLTTSASAASASRYSGGYGYVGWAVFGYTFMANAFFLVSPFLKLMCGSRGFGGMVDCNSTRSSATRLAAP